MHVIRSLTVIATSVFIIGAGVVLAETADDGLPASAGHDTFVRVCSACHPPELVMDKRLDRAGWEEVVQNMIGRGARPTEAEMAEILDYLAAAYPARRTVVPATPAAKP
jgi:competence protein ComEA